MSELGVCSRDDLYRVLHKTKMPRPTRKVGLQIYEVEIAFETTFAAP